MFTFQQRTNPCMAMAILAGILGLSGHASAGPQPTNSVRLTLELRCGSRLIGTPTAEQIPLITRHGRLEIPLDHINTVTFNNDRETARFELTNRDSISGVPGLSTFDLHTIVGDLSIGTELINTVSTSTCGALTNGLLLHYPFDDPADAQVRDRSGAGHHAKVMGSPVRGDGIHGGALLFDGRDDYLDLGRPDTLDTLFDDGTFTIALWIRSSDRRDYRNEFGVFYSNRNTNPYVGGSVFRFGPKAGRLGLTSTFGGNVSDTIIADGTWHHVAVIGDNGQTLLYVDGTEVSRKPFGRYKRQPAGSICIGACYDGVNQANYLDGLMDDFRVYDRALTAKEIGQLSRTN